MSLDSIKVNIVAWFCFQTSLRELATRFSARFPRLIYTIMVGKPKRTAAGGTSLRQSPRVAQSSAPPQGSNQASSVKNFFTFRGESTKPGPAENARILVPALKNLLPNMKKFMIELGGDSSGQGQPKMITIGVARNVLAKLTDSPLIQRMSKERIDITKFFAAVLDYAQEALGLPTKPRASEVALVENKEDKTVDVLLYKLNELGMFPESWPLPLTAAGMKKKNRTKSRGENAPLGGAVKEGDDDEEPVRKPGRKQEGEEEEDEEKTVVPIVAPVTGKKRGRKPKNPISKIATEGAPAADIIEEQNAAAAGGGGGGGGGDDDNGSNRRTTGRNVGKTKQMLDSSDGDDDDYYNTIEKGDQPPAAKRSKPACLPKPKQSNNNLKGSSGSSRYGLNESIDLVTSAQRQSCYWLRRTGLAAAGFRDQKQRHNPPAPLKATDLISCHDCQCAHVRHVCQGECAKSYCQQCCRHYEYLFSSQPGDVLEPLLKKFNEGVCPCCLDICARKDCLRKRSKMHFYSPQVSELDREERKVMALHMAQCLAHVHQQLERVGEIEANRQNTTVSAAHQLPKSAVDHYRLLCNRCATSMENVIVHCACGADFCPQCCADLMGDKKGPLQCPVCLNTTTTSIQRVLSKPLINKLNNTQAVLDKTVGRGGAAVNAYDYNCKLWRLPTAADNVAKGNDLNGANGSRSRMAKKHQNGSMPPPQQAAIAAAAAPPVYTGRVIGEPNGCVPPLGAPVLQSITAATPTAGNTTSTAMAAHARRQGVNALSMHLLGKPVDSISGEQQMVVDAVFSSVLKGELQYSSILGISVASWAGLVKHQVNVIRNIRNMDRNGIVANGNGIRHVSVRDGQQQQVVAADGAGPSTAAAAAAPIVGPNLVRLPRRPITTIPGCVDLISWHKDLPPEDYRIASNRPNGLQNYIWTPHVSDFSRASPRRHETVQRFVQRWAAGEPIIIRGMRGRVNWGPNVVMRAARDMKVGLKDIAVTDCSDWDSETVISAESFFRMYTACHGPTHDITGIELSMYKLKDFPPEDTFVNRCKRHNDDFLQMLDECMPEYMHPNGGVLNLASKLPESAVPPDLGPKGYIAFGREKEHEGIEGDSVTRLHEDLSDAINILCHVQHSPGRKTPPIARCGDSPMNNGPSFGGAGALWDLYRREDIPVLRQFILDVVGGKVKCPGFYYKGKKLTLEDIKDPVHDQAIMLTTSHRAAAALPPYNLHSWMIEQYEYEGVVIPAACAHQVRNLRSCIKIALDFVSPESVPHCLAQREERRVLAMEEVKERGGHLVADEEIEQRHFHDKLQVVNMVVHGLSDALNVLEDGTVRGKEGVGKTREKKITK